jgi:hypothetical protein
MRGIRCGLSFRPGRCQGHKLGLKARCHTRFHRRLHDEMLKAQGLHRALPDADMFTSDSPRRQS